ncbi:MAG TPA: lipid-A-disaccharide synthase [Thermoanaerobaculia bacterium]|nr:lipid-A-disaccharide synthase [Thermoanaerobaculia bacterium]
MSPERLVTPAGVARQPQAAPEVMIVAGEASGDLHGSRLLHELRALHPDLSSFGMGGQLMVAEGLETLADSREIAVIGLTEALRVVPRAHQILRALERAARDRRPAVAVLIDSPDFNLPLAKRLHRAGTPVVYYVSPQIWAWRESRVATVARCVDRMLVLFGFEVDFYRRHGVEVEHVGHPLVDEVASHPQAWEVDGSAEREVRLALLPGSRRSEVEALLPCMLEGARLLGRRRNIRVRVIVAPGLDRGLLESIVERTAAGAAAAGGRLAVEWIEEARHRVIADSHLAFCASGTATLEVGLLGTPMVVVYRLNRWTYWLARRLVRVPHIALVNLVLGARVVPELVQVQTEPANLAETAERLLGDRATLDRMREELRRLRPALGEGGASRRAARAVARWLVATAGGTAEGASS